MLEANRVALSGIERDIRGKIDESTRVIGDVIVREGAVIENSELRGPLIIGAGTLVRTIVAMSFELGLDIVAEGVENEAQARCLTTLGCHELQGFHFSKPLDEPALLAFLNGESA